MANDAGKAGLGRKRKTVQEETLAPPTKQSRSLFSLPLPSFSTVATSAFYPNAVFSFSSSTSVNTAAEEEASIKWDQVGFEDVGASMMLKESGEDANQNARDARNLELESGVILEGKEGDQDAILSGNLGMEEHQSSCQIDNLEDDERILGEEEEKLEESDQIGVGKEGNQTGNLEEEQKEKQEHIQPLATSSQKFLQDDVSDSDDILVIDLSDSSEVDEVQYVCNSKKEESRKTNQSGNLAEGVKSAANVKFADNKDAAQPSTRATAVVPRPAGQAKPAQAHATAGENKLTNGDSLASNRDAWNFVNRCWEGAFPNHPGPCFKVKCPTFKASAPANVNCTAIMHLTNLKKHMQKVHNSQEDNLRCPACGFKVSCSALHDHVKQNHNCCKPKLSANLVPDVNPLPSRFLRSAGRAPIPLHSVRIVDVPSPPVPPLNHSSNSHTANTTSNGHVESSGTVAENQVTGRSLCALNKVPEKHHPGTIWARKDIFKE